MKAHLLSLFNVQLILLVVHLTVTDSCFYTFVVDILQSMPHTFFKLQFITFISVFLPYRQPIFPSGFLIIEKCHYNSAESLRDQPINFAQGCGGFLVIKETDT